MKIVTIISCDRQFIFIYLLLYLFFMIYMFKYIFYIQAKQIKYTKRVILQHINLNKYKYDFHRRTYSNLYIVSKRK